MKVLFLINTLKNTIHRSEVTRSYEHIDNLLIENYRFVKNKNIRVYPNHDYYVYNIVDGTTDYQYNQILTEYLFEMVDFTEYEKIMLYEKL